MVCKWSVNIEITHCKKFITFLLIWNVVFSLYFSIVFFVRVIVNVFDHDCDDARAIHDAVRAPESVLGKIGINLIFS